MIVVLKPLIFERLKPDLVKLNVIELDEDNDRYYYDRKKKKRRSTYDSNGCEIDLSSLTKKETNLLLRLLEDCDVHGCKIAAADIKKYLRIAEQGIHTARARTCRQAAWMLEFFFAELPHHIIFSEDEYGGKSHSGFWVGDVEYHPKQEGSRHEHPIPEHTDIEIWHIENDYRKCSSIYLSKGDCHEMTCLEILAKQGYVIETPKLMDKLRAETERYYEERERIGKQYIASGAGLCDLDNALEKSRDDYYGSRRSKINLEHFGQKTKVVIDVLKEKEDKDNDRHSGSSHPDPYRWHKWNMRFHTPNEDEIVRHLEADEDTAEPIDVDIPVHPLVPCFDLRRHVRLRVHVNNLTPYIYDSKTAERLVLPARDWNMVNLLVDHSANTFKDIVSNKGQSMNVLAVGPPGTGKTATAEVFAEFKKRPLYTIQCSQLGMDAESVEHNLGVIMDRANRWNAVLLLDEADVYIRKRGVDLNQNAIVGAFLRVLEYASCILFMTTNLGDEVDDAITSRCIAKLVYEAPDKPSQTKIWRILTDLNELKLDDKEIAKIVNSHPHLTGRDVKNLLKLASFVAQSNGKPLDAAAVDYAKQFKPTQDFFEDKN